MCAALLPALAMAQQQDVPLRLGYQGRLLKSDGTPLTGLQAVTFSLYPASTGGTAVWTETQQVALTNGFYATFLGASTPLGTTTTPSPTVFSGADLFLGVTVAGSELKPRQRLGSVAYAFRAAQAVEAMHAARATNADNATNATNAAHATIADSATNAGHAASADSATNVSGAGNVSAATGSFGNVVVSGRVDANVIAGRVVGGVRAYKECTKFERGTCVADQWRCDAWGDGRCPSDGQGDCHGGSNSGTLRGDPVLGTGALCIQ